MEFEAELESEIEAISTSKLPLLSMVSPPMQMQSPEHSGMLTPPLYTLASVPFRWEEEPGKPRPCTSIIPFPATTASGFDQPKCLELPPRLLLPPAPEPTKITKTPSPTTVLEGPYRPKFTSSSFRFFRERHGSFDSSSSRSPERGQLISTVVLGSKKQQKGSGGIGVFGSWGPKLMKEAKKEVNESSSILQYPSSSSTTSMDAGGFWSDEDSIKKVKISGIRRNGSFSSLSQARSRFWAAVYQGFKQVIPWKNRKSKKGGLI